MDFEDGIPLINKAFEKIEEQKAWQMWLIKFQHMDKSNFVEFSKFYKQLKKPKVIESEKNSEELLEMAEKIKKIDQKIT